MEVRFQLLFEVAVGVVIGAFPVYLLVRALKTGTWNGRGIDVVRAERPFAFWFGVVMYALVAVIILVGTLYLAWLALGQD